MITEQNPPAQIPGGTQAGPAPQRHWPLESQASPIALIPSAPPPAVQLTHMRPLAPQSVSERVRHWLLRQQPWGHDAAVHAHRASSPAMLASGAHSWPGRHAACVPQRHWPSLLHWFAWSPHDMHICPPVPHCIGVGGAMHALPEQHPVPQVPGPQSDVQIPDTQGPDEQLTQLPPPVPHCVLVVPGRQTLPSQHPVHDDGSHTQLPPLQRWPAPQGAPVPHAHWPLAVQRSAERGLHAVHVMPAGAHALRVSGVVHVSPEQQPVGQLVASHTQAPPLQRWPAPHAGLLPHAQVPSLAHESARVGSHGAQRSPGAAHVAPDSSVQRSLTSQQPAGQELGSHTHEPLSQRWPGSHAGPPPHVHVPPTHASASVGSHATHAAAPAPHASNASTLHVLPVQHPLAHVAELQPAHAPAALHPEPPQLSQSAPPLPHCASTSPGRHVSPSQQPPHESPSHTQLPPSQRWPAAHAGPDPQAQSPPESQPSATSGSQTVHAPPGAPQLASSIAWHVPSAAQQPLGHDAAVHRQVPEASHSCPSAHAAPAPH